MLLLDLSFYRAQIGAALTFTLRPDANIEQAPLAKSFFPFIALVLCGIALAILGTLPLIGLQIAGAALPGQEGAVTAPVPLTMLLLVGALFVPIIEETAFRGVLRPHVLTLSLAAAAWGYLLCGVALHGNLAAFHWAAPLWQMVLQVVAAGAFGGMAFFAAARAARALTPGAKWLRLFPALYWLTIIGFAFAHLGRFGGLELERLWLLAPLLVLPQLVAGIIFGFARMRYGLLAAIVAHGLHNGLLTLLFAWL